ncbi:MAG: shikimate kinase [Pyrinomonadaceae bacterium]
MKARSDIALTGFMGVGKTSVARHLAVLLKCEAIDLDKFIETNERRKVAEIIENDGISAYRNVESANLRKLLVNSDVHLLSLGGGTWTLAENREIIKSRGFISIWLESSFEHCWSNIRRSRKARPLAGDKSSARVLFEERQKHYCLADWHFIVKPEFTSFDVASHIFEQLA